MKPHHYRRWALALGALCLFTPSARAQYDPPAGYYNSAVGLTGAPLKAALNAIIDGHSSVSYSNREPRLEILDQDPANSANVILVYSGYSVSKAIFPGGAANTEHLWPNGYGIDDSSPAHGDLFNLRPCGSDVNGTRGNKYYDDGGVIPAHPEAPLCRADGDSWEPRAVEKGDIARAMFYVDTRYEGDATDGLPRNLVLTDNVASITTTGNNFGKLSTLISWHFADPVDDSERQRNHIIFQASYGGQTFQQNRNPFIDHPEYVWAIWGPAPNDSRLYLGGVEPSNGASAVALNFGAVIVGGPLPAPQNVTLNKTGANPTTFEITLSGDVASAQAGPRQSFIAGAQNRVLTVSLTGSTAASGILGGSLVVDNTDLTSAGTGRGSADGDDVVSASLTVLDHAAPSFSGEAPQPELTLDFGLVLPGSGVHTLNFAIHNRDATPGLTAALDLDAISGAGDTAQLSTDLAPFAALAPGASLPFVASLDTTTPGVYSATFTLELSDENLPGATSTPNLMLTLVAEVGVPVCLASDANCDDVITPDDIAPFVDVLLEMSGPCAFCTADINGDSLIDAADIQPFLDEVLP
ncbi:MAG: hypothetical protein DCC65_16700 [Planctomycetota bacterium]|nr:MAG: hypothetical protein DCC65_16700 [Planctomycetota bacterium]